MRVDGKNVFISGPMTGFEHYNCGAFIDAHILLKGAGAAHVFNPAIEWLTYEGEERTHADWMRHCTNELTDTFLYAFEVLVSLPGWESSPGATFERTVAETCGIEVCELSEVEP